MATLKYTFIGKDKRKDGTCPISLRLIKNREIVYISTGFHMDPKYWKDGVKSTHPQYNRMKALLLTRERETWERILEEEKNNPEVTAKQLKNILTFNGADFYQYAARFIKNYTNNTLKGYNISINKLKTFRPVLNFSEITFEFLRNYEGYLKESAPNTIASHFKRLKTIILSAIKDGVTKTNPFEHYKIRWKPGKKEYLTLDELNALKNLKVNIPEVIKARDLFIFQFNCWGMRIADTLKLRWEENINGDILSYKMRKTAKYMDIELTPAARAIIGPNQTKGYIFDYSKRFKNLESAVGYINSKLAAAAQLCDIKKNVTTHVARHTWTSMGVLNDINLRQLQQMLGHTDIRTTMGYALFFTNKELYASNRKITG